MFNFTFLGENMIEICLYYKNVRLVPYNHLFDEQTVLWLNDPKVSKNFGLTNSVSLDSHRRWIASQQNLLMWAILDLESIHQGNVLLNLNPRHRSAYFQIYIGNQYARGKGIGYAASKSVLRYAFDDLNLNRIWLHTNLDNVVAIKLYEKLGFIKEGIERESILRNKEFCDQLRWSILKKDWDRQQEERNSVK